MITVNGCIVNCTQFPDGTSSMRCENYGSGKNIIEWKFDGDHECIIIWHLVHHIRANDPETCIFLFLPYIPNARMDRVKACDEVFTLKWFAEFINALNFTKVFVEDPHSNVSAALIDRVDIKGVGANVRATINLIGANKDEVLFCYPDEGATKKYSDQIKGEYVFGIKHRDWRTGNIQKFELVGADKVRGRTVLIVDDICSRGGTFMHTAKALKEAGAGKVFLYITHCENTIFNGELLSSDLIEHIYTTDSIYRGCHKKITVL